MPARLGEHAVVVGGSVAGLLAARVLVRHYRRVTILERDRLPAGPDARKPGTSTCCSPPADGSSSDCTPGSSPTSSRPGPRTTTRSATWRGTRRRAKANTRPWLLATVEDYRYAEAEGPPPGFVVRLAHRYVGRVTALAARDPAVRRRFTEVVHLVRGPLSLLAPGVIARALFAGRRVGIADSANLPGFPASVGTRPTSQCAGT